MIINNKFRILVLVLSFGLITSANAQQNQQRDGQQRRTSESAAPRQTIPPMQTLEPEVVSTAEEIQRAEEEATNNDSDATRDENSTGRTSRGTKNVSEVSRNNKKSSIDRQQRSLLELERLTRAEERAESLRRQLTEAIEKEDVLRSKLERLTYQARPEIIERESAAFGSLRPEEERETRRRMLESEKVRVNEQLRIILESRARLQMAVANSDTLVDRLRASFDASLDSDNSSKTTNSNDDSEGNEIEQDSNLPR